MRWVVSLTKGTAVLAIILICVVAAPFVIGATISETKALLLGRKIDKIFVSVFDDVRIYANFVSIEPDTGSGDYCDYVYLRIFRYWGLNAAEMSASLIDRIEALAPPGTFPKIDAEVVQRGDVLMLWVSAGPEPHNLDLRCI